MLNIQCSMILKKTLEIFRNKIQMTVGYAVEEIAIRDVYPILLIGALSLVAANSPYETP